MYGLIGRIKALPGRREDLTAVMRQEDGSMPGCLSYVVAEDPNDPDALWVTEVWTDEAAWRASLSLPAVQAAVAKGKPLIAGFDHRVVTNVLGGIGLGGKR
jgi:quinol monooxygenase YgiN